MNYFYLTLLLTPIIAWKLNNLNCPESKSDLNERCDPSDYPNYLDCVSNRQKREDTDCSSDCNDCDCEECSEGGCSSTCNTCCSSNCNQCNCQQCSSGGCSSNCNNCCQNQEDCQTHYCCYRTCHSKCSNTDCRRSCRKSCEDRVDRKTFGLNQSGSHNQTTHIKTVLEIFNEINNTNEIRIPVDVNTTSFNNITVITGQSGKIEYSDNNPYAISYPPYQQQYPPQYQPPYRPQQPPQRPEQLPEQPSQPQEEFPPSQYPKFRPPYPFYPQIEPTSCCTIATPRQCVPQPRIPYVNCYYQTQRVCNNVCQANRVIHPYVEQVCDEGISSGCQNQVFYSPQPRPTCAFGRSWPYFGCGVPQFPCSGCYEQPFDVSRCPDYCGGYGMI